MLDYLVQLQTIIRERIASLGVTVLDSPRGGQGLYIYPERTLHCVLLNEVFESQPTFADICSRKLDKHSWLYTDVSDISAFEVQPRWLFTFPRKTHPEDPSTRSFSLQVYVEESVVKKLQTRFGGFAKVYPSGSAGLVRGATNLARLMSDHAIPLGTPITKGIRQIFGELHEQFSHPKRFAVDRLSLVISDSWMSNDSPEVKSYHLVTR